MHLKRLTKFIGSNTQLLISHGNLKLKSFHQTYKFPAHTPIISKEEELEHKENEMPQDYMWRDISVFTEEMMSEEELGL